MPQRAQVFRLPGRRAAAGIPAVVALGFFVWAAIKPTPLRGLIADCVAGIVFAAIAQRAWVSEIRVSSDGVRVRRLLGSTVVPWAEIESFDVGQTAVLLAVRIIRLDDKPLGALNLGAGGYRRELRRAELQLIADRLNEILAERRAHPA